MNKTLKNNDYLLVVNPFFTYEPENGDIVVIHGNYENYKLPIVKRVIATEGQTLTINIETKQVFINGELFVYGTPWCGKEGYNTNSSAPLSAICFLEQGKTNVIDRIPPEDALIRVFPQILFPETEASADLLFPLLDKMLTTVPAYRLICDISDEAVAVAYNAMKGN